MKIHFIWFGSIPHHELLAKIAAKIRYLNSIFNQIPNTSFFVWTSPDLIEKLKSMFINEHLLQSPYVSQHRNPINLDIKNLWELFNFPTTSYLSSEDIQQIRTLFLKESAGPISNKAVAADILKFLVGFYIGGLYIDAGLEIKSSFGNNKMRQQLSSLNNTGNTLFNKLANIDYAVTRFGNSTSPDLQIMFFSQKENAKIFLSETLKAIVLDRNRFVPPLPTVIPPRRKYKLSHLLLSCLGKNRSSQPKPSTPINKYNKYQIDNTSYYDINRDLLGRTKDPSLKGVSYTGTNFGAKFNKYLILSQFNSNSYSNDDNLLPSMTNHRIDYFVITGNQFDDFPEIYTKNQETQKYENYRTKTYKHQDDF